MRYIIILFAFVVFSSGVSLEELYLKNGIEAVQKTIENNIQSNSYWKNAIKNKDISLGYYKDDTMVITVSKQEKLLEVFNQSKGKLNKKLTKNVIVGKEGPKEKQGDLKTPVGTYNILKRFEPQDRFYGPLAFSISYPNLIDQLQGKNGYGIWIHGHPLENGETRDTLSRGCVVLENDILLEFDKIIGENKAVTIISEHQIPLTTPEEISTILASLFQWRNYWKINDVEKYLTFYDNDFKRFDGKGIKQFSEMKRRIFSKNEEKEIIFSDITISPYPNINGEKMFKISFYENYKTKNHQFNGNKYLYVKLVNNNMKILAER